MQSSSIDRIQQNTYHNRESRSLILINFPCLSIELAVKYKEIKQQQFFRTYHLIKHMGVTTGGRGAAPLESQIDTKT